MIGGEASGHTTFAVGTRLGAFEILGPIASGGMGSVYRVRSTLTGELRALKVIRADLAANATFVQRFVREIQITASLAHPNLVRVFEPGMADGVMFLPMELLTGETLGAHLTHSGALSLPSALEILLPVCDAVHAVHARGVIHRDLKPSNIILERGSGTALVPKILDFGAAKLVVDETAATVEGTLIGSVHYMAPEQARGAQDLDARVDQYALAVIAYQLLTGSRPYESDPTATALAKLLERAPYPRPTERASSLPAAVDAVLARAMSHDRRNRYASVAELRDALAALLTLADTESTVAVNSDELLARAAATKQRRAPIAERVESSTLARAVVEAPAGRGRPPRVSSRRELLSVLVIIGTGVVAVALFLRSSINEPATPGPAASTPAPPSAAAPPLVFPIDDEQRVDGSVVAGASSEPLRITKVPAAASPATPSSRIATRPKISPPAVSSEPPCTPRPGVPCPP